jgi:5'-nucleotidase
VLALITNDDGIDAPGLRVLTEAAVACGLDVLVAAPEHESSGASSSLSAVGDDGELLTRPVSIEGMDVKAMAVGAVPAFIVFSACQGAFGPPPDLVLSGVNHGPNLGQAVLHSGTVGAALTASVHGRRGLAISTDVGGPTQTAVGRIAEQAIAALLAMPERAVLNVNVPDVAGDALRGVVRADLASFGAVQATVVGASEDKVRLDINPTQADAEPGTDVALMAEGWATVTPLRSISEADVDLGDLVSAPAG